MSYQLLDSVEAVQVYSPQLVADVLVCTIQSFPSGSVLLRTIPQTSFDSDQGQALLESLSAAVEGALEGGEATSAYGLQLVDDSGLLADLVRFTVTYQPATATPGEITATVDVPVNVLTADTGFGGALAGGSAADRINTTYQRLAAMATGG